MATEFKILRGNKANLFYSDGSIKLPKEKLVNGYWYLTNDTAEVYVCLPSDPQIVDSPLTLKKINDDSVESFDPEVKVVSTFTDLTPPAEEATEEIYIVEDENATYRWTGSSWACTGRDYTEILLIDGGKAHE